ncbi:discoidin/SUN/FTP domain-containing protein [Brevibacterium zhoupengii]|uniref:hypothetical protein n=1 Tax=Brevibacterium zhoupengii TaxID=2898795 RepID=UPI001E2D4BFC|nr:hypothetical protein [Brevibacterium zhoupengii]
MPKVKDLQPLSNLANETTPSIGYFGGNWFDRLDLPHHGTIARVTIARTDNEADFLNLRGILARKSGKVVHLDDDQIEILQSSVRKENNYLPQGLSSLENLHTMREKNPWWQINLKEPIQIDALQIFNRADSLGLRSRAIRVTIEDAESKECVLYDSTSKAHRATVLDDVSAIAGGDVANEEIQNVAEARRWRNNTVRAVVERVKMGMPLPNRAVRNSLCALIPTKRAPNSWHELQGDDWFLLAYILCAQVHEMPGARSAYRNFEFVLPTREHLERLESEINRATKSIGASAMQLLHHGLSPKGELKKKLPELRRLVKDLASDLHSYNQSTLLAAYGSLLGGVRTGHLIEHDDDFDVFAPIHASSKAEYITKLDELRDYLKGRGWNVHANGQYFNSHVTKPSVTANIDLFGLWINDRIATVHMENMKLREIPSEWFETGNSISIDGIKIAIPKHAEDFLSLRYGSNWRHPDKYYDWRWKLR